VSEETFLTFFRRGGQNMARTNYNGAHLSVAWLEDEFRKKFEADPVDAFAYLKRNETVFRSKYGDYFLEELGLEGDNVVLLNLETIPWDVLIFGSVGERLDEFIQA